MTQYDKQRIVQMRRDGKTQREVARALGCSKTYVRDVEQRAKLNRNIKVLLDVVLESGKSVEDFSEDELDALDWLHAYANPNGGADA